MRLPAAVHANAESVQASAVPNAAHSPMPINSEKLRAEHVPESVRLTESTLLHALGCAMRVCGTRRGRAGGPRRGQLWRRPELHSIVPDIFGDKRCPAGCRQQSGDRTQDGPVRFGYHGSHVRSPAGSLHIRSVRSGSAANWSRSPCSVAVDWLRQPISPHPDLPVAAVLSAPLGEERHVPVRK